MTAGNDVTEKCNSSGLCLTKVVVVAVAATARLCTPTGILCAADLVALK